MKITLAATGAVTNSNTGQREQAKKERDRNQHSIWISFLISLAVFPETICNDEVADEA